MQITRVLGNDVELAIDLESILYIRYEYKNEKLIIGFNSITSDVESISCVQQEYLNLLTRWKNWTKQQEENVIKFSEEDGV